MNFGSPLRLCKKPSGFWMMNSSVSIVSASNAAAAVFLMRVEAHTIRATRSNPGISNSIFLCCFSGELPTRSVYVAAARSSDVCRDASGFEDALKPLYALGRRGFVIQLLGTVVRDQVYLDTRQLVAVEQTR